MQAIVVVFVCCFCCCGCLFHIQIFVCQSYLSQKYEWQYHVTWSVVKQQHFSFFTCTELTDWDSGRMSYDNQFLFKKINFLISFGFVHQTTLVICHYFCVRNALLSSRISHSDSIFLSSSGYLSTPFRIVSSVVKMFSFFPRRHSRAIKQQSVFLTVVTLTFKGNY